MSTVVNDPSHEMGATWDQARSLIGEFIDHEVGGSAVTPPWGTELESVCDDTKGWIHTFTTPTLRVEISHGAIQNIASKLFLGSG